MKNITEYQLKKMWHNPERTTIFLPDMFQSFLKQTPVINPHYESVKLESEDWLSNFCSFTPKMQMKISKCNFSYFCAIAAPYASRTEFQTLCDWGNWVFPFDDMFDNGELRDRPEQAKRVMDSLLNSMQGGKPDENKLRIVEVHDSVVERMFIKTSTGKAIIPARASFSNKFIGTQQRFAKAMQGYCYGALTHVDDNAAGRSPSLEEMALIRRESSGVRPLYHLIEYAHDLQVPDEVFDDPMIQKLEDLGVDMVSVSNDMLSYRKEQVEGVPHNMVTVCRAQGMPAQMAFDTVGKLLQSLYCEWDRTEGRVPSWGEVVDREVRKYIEGIKTVVQANLNWSFKSERYLGPNPENVRQTRRLDILAN